MSNKKTVCTQDLRTTLKHLFAQQLQQLPAVLESMPAKDRVDCLLKMMPFLFPRIKEVGHQTGEPGEFEIQELYH